MKKIFSSIIISICIVLSFCIGCNNQNVVVAGFFNPFNFNKKETVIDENGNVEEKKEETKFNITNINGYRDKNNATYVEIEFDKDIEDKFDVTSYIKINPNISFTASKVNNKIIVNADFNTSTKYAVTVLKNIKAFDGTLLKNDTTENILFDQKQPRGRTNTELNRSHVFLNIEHQDEEDLKEIEKEKERLKNLSKMNMSVDTHNLQILNEDSNNNLLESTENVQNKK